MGYVGWVGDKLKWGVMGEKKWGILGNMLILKEGGWRKQQAIEERRKEKQEEDQKEELRKRGDNKKDFAGEKLNQQKEFFFPSLPLLNPSVECILFLNLSS